MLIGKRRKYLGEYLEQVKEEVERTYTQHTAESIHSRFIPIESYQFGEWSLASLWNIRAKTWHDAQERYIAAMG